MVGTVEWEVVTEDAFGPKSAVVEASWEEGPRRSPRGRPWEVMRLKRSQVGAAKKPDSIKAAGVRGICEDRFALATEGSLVSSARKNNKGQVTRKEVS